MILLHQRAQGHEAKVTNCISLSLLLLVDLLYAEDGELLMAAHIGKECSERVTERFSGIGQQLRWWTRSNWSRIQTLKVSLVA